MSQKFGVDVHWAGAYPSIVSIWLETKSIRCEAASGWPHASHTTPGTSATTSSRRRLTRDSAADGLLEPLGGPPLFRHIGVHRDGSDHAIVVDDRRSGRPDEDVLACVGATRDDLFDDDLASQRAREGQAFAFNRVRLSLQTEPRTSRRARGSPRSGPPAIGAPSTRSPAAFTRVIPSGVPT